MLESAEDRPPRSQARLRSATSRTLREALLNAQYDLLERKRGPVLVLISGVEGGGRGETANKLTNGWTRATSASTRSARAPPRNSRTRPRGATGARCRRAGKIGIFMNAWYREA